MVELQFLKSHFLFEDPNSLSYLELMLKNSHYTVTLRQFGQLCLTHITFPQLISSRKISDDSNYFYQYIFLLGYHYMGTVGRPVVKQRLPGGRGKDGHQSLRSNVLGSIDGGLLTT